MKPWFARLALVLALLAPLDAAAADGLHVVATIRPVYAFLLGLMRDADTPELLIDGDRTPYDYRLDARGRRLLEQADLVVWVGPELETSLATPLAALKKTGDDGPRVVELLASQTLKILPSRDRPDERDPFFWLDDRNALILLDELTEWLVRIDPQRAHIYIRNRRRMRKPLRRLDRVYEYGYRGLKGAPGVAYYDTLQYFEQAYAMKLLDHVGASPRHPGSTAALLRVRARLASGEARCLLLERGMPAPGLSVLTEGLKVHVGELDSLGLGIDPGPELYLKLMQHNTGVIRECLGSRGGKADELLDAGIDEGDAGDGIGGRFVLTDQFGDSRTEQDFLGHYSLVYFGYTHCPDVCPTTLQTMASALRRLGDKAKRVQPYFISVDPQRDSPRTLRDYVAYFDPRLIGMTGTPAMLKRVAAGFRVRFRKGEVDPAHPDLYLVDHSASLYLMGPDGRFITKFANGIMPRDLARRLDEIIP